MINNENMQNENNPLLNEDYIREVREKWLRSLKISFGLPVVLAVLFLFFVYLTLFFSYPPKPSEIFSFLPSSLELSWYILGPFIITLLLAGQFFSAWLFYRFSYKKEGIKLLGIFIILEFIGLIEQAFESYEMWFLEFDALFALKDIGIIVISLYFWVNCIKLFRVNRALKKARKMA